MNINTITLYPTFFKKFFNYSKEKKFQYITIFIKKSKYNILMFIIHRIILNSKIKPLWTILVIILRGILLLYIYDKVGVDSLFFIFVLLILIPTINYIFDVIFTVLRKIILSIYCCLIIFLKN